MSNTTQVSTVKTSPTTTTGTISVVSEVTVSLSIPLAPAITNLNMTDLAVKEQISKTIKTLLHKSTEMVNPFGNTGKMIMMVDIVKKNDQKRRNTVDFVAVVKLKVLV